LRVRKNLNIKIIELIELFNIIKRP
jgi:hypothetical protein